MKPTKYLDYILITAVLVFSGFCMQAETGHPAEEYQFVSNDGAWCWFSDPRAIYVDDQVIGGYVDDEGSIWCFKYDPETQERQNVKIHDRLHYDDHANPSLLELSDGRIAMFYSGHGAIVKTPLYYRVTKKSGDISEWEEEQAIQPAENGSHGICYSNPVRLSSEDNRVYVFYRGGDFKPNFVYSDDMKTWSEGYSLIKNDEGYGTKGRPYTKICSNGKDKIFFAFTDGHPRDRATNSIYFMMYDNGKLRKANGEIISKNLFDAVSPSQADKVYDATKTFDKAWIWDVAFDKEENPVIVYSRCSHSFNRHSYWYARWNGKEWSNCFIADAFQFFMRKDYNDKNVMEKEVNYSGGVILDHENPDIVYTSRPISNVFEIEKWTFDTRSGKFTSEAVTTGSARDNIRPYVIRNHEEGQPSVLWAYNYYYPFFREYVSAIRIGQLAKPFDSSLDKESIMAVASKVADWQIRDFSEHQPDSKTLRNWKSGVMFNGMFDWAEYYQQQRNDDRYFRFIQETFNEERWAPGNRVYHADDLCICQCYLDMYRKSGNPDHFLPTLSRTEWIVDNAPEGDLADAARPKDRWSWCDALYMGPAVFTRMYSITGDKKFIRFSDKEFKASLEHLYDKEEHLFYRDKRFFGKREKNGEKVFWGRGNGWVLGGLAEILKTLPENDRKYRPFYTDLFKEMCERIIDCQDTEGYWHASLLDPDSFPDPETSATGLITYALAYGVNSGILDASAYRSPVEKGWKALVRAVDTEGKLNWVQPVGSSPQKSEKSTTELYGTGGFLMAAAEVGNMIGKE